MPKEKKDRIGLIIRESVMVDDRAVGFAASFGIAMPSILFDIFVGRRSDKQSGDFFFLLFMWRNWLIRKNWLCIMAKLVIARLMFINPVKASFGTGFFHLRKQKN